MTRQLENTKAIYYTYTFDPTIREYEIYLFTHTLLKVEDYEQNTWNELIFFKLLISIIKALLTDHWIIWREFRWTRRAYYSLAYIANRDQIPARRNKGKEGDGKNRLLDIFKNIFGEKIYWFGNIKKNWKSFSEQYWNFIS